MKWFCLIFQDFKREALGVVDFAGEGDTYLFAGSIMLPDTSLYVTRFRYVARVLVRCMFNVFKSLLAFDLLIFLLPEILIPLQL
jgi:hypothetical protein